MDYGPCRYDRYMDVATLLSRWDGDPPEVCRDPAQYTTVLANAGDEAPLQGVVIRIDVELCAFHDMQMSTAPGYLRSIRHSRTS